TAAAKGRILFSRPSDRKMDRTFSLETNDRDVVDIPLTGLAKGQWRLSVEWMSNKKQYLYKSQIVTR
ncbi:MAG: FixH family protein, partial [Mucilaginibacter sp.]